MTGTPAAVSRSSGFDGVARSDRHHRDPGDALGLELRGRALVDRRVRRHLHPDPHPPVLVADEVERHHLPDRQAAEAHVGGAAEPGDVVEEDVVIGVLAVDLELRQPDEEAERRAGCRPACRPRSARSWRGSPSPSLLSSTARAARARGPWKYSCTHGWSTFSMSAIVPVTSTFFSASTAMRSQVACRVSRSWVTMNTVSPERLELEDQVVEGVGADRVEAGRRLVEEDDVGVERDRPGEAGALLHAAGELGGELRRRRSAAGRPSTTLSRASASRSRRLDVEELAHRRLDVLLDGQRREQRPLLEEHPPAPADRGELGVGAVEDVDAEDPDRAGRRAVQPDDRAQQHRLAGARAADDAEHLAPVDVEVRGRRGRPGCRSG